MKTTTEQLDLTRANATGQNWGIGESTYASAQGVISPGAWAAAVVALEGSIDGSTWAEITTISADGITAKQDVTAYAVLRFRVKTENAGAGTANLTICHKVA